MRAGDRLGHGRQRSPALPVVFKAFVEHDHRVAGAMPIAYQPGVLHKHLREIGREDLIDEDLDIGTQLEFGVSSRTLLSLIELGLSRMSAVILYEKIARDDLTKEDCLAWLSERRDSLEAMDIPVIIVRELRERLLPPDDPTSQLNQEA